MKVKEIRENEGKGEVREDFLPKGRHNPLDIVHTSANYIAVRGYI